MKYVAFIIAFLWLVIFFWPLSYCAAHGCSGPDLDAFMPAFALALVGIPSLIWSFFHILKRIWPQSKVVPIAEKSVWIILALLIAGCIIRQSHARHQLQIMERSVTKQQ